MERQEYDIVRARKFEIVDEEGQVRAAIGPGEEGSTGVQFYDREGEAKIQLSVSSSGSGELWLRDSSGSDQAAIYTESGDGPFVSLTHTGEGAEESWAVGLSGIGQQGERSPSVALTAGASPRVLITVLKDGPPCIILYDEEGNEVWRQVGLPG